jgi:predicted amidophosphoribosyltransferase
MRKLGDGAELQSALVRARETMPQTGLPGDARRSNMCSAFSAAHALDPSCTYIVVDDVVTTGATLVAALEAMRKGGATDVAAVALAR